MNRRVVQIAAWLFLAVVASSCATPSIVGRWAVEDDVGYTGLAFERDGTCKIIGVEKAGVAGGTMCNYLVDGDAAKIVAVWDSTTKQAVDPPVPVAYDRVTDTISMTQPHPRRLRRTAKLLGE
jgi:hypothetical protein